MKGKGTEAVEVNPLRPVRNIASAFTQATRAAVGARIDPATAFRLFAEACETLQIIDLPQFRRE